MNSLNCHPERSAAESNGSAPPPPAFGENILPVGVETRDDIWGTAPESCDPSAIRNSQSSQFPPSTFSPPPVNNAPLDWDTAMAELDRLELLAVTLRMQMRIRLIELSSPRGFQTEP